ncbi:hypothetical protein [Roseomonas xinghualingensis]|uniref:hypothetical protein n=1 Tax=Roseomonas xinghualingensis TaxID=2986475 RepID=UPI0021F123FD|nr:hypothetical protein [Roseomonas sp. SXEYE001]MCV4210204.1 hypothetical protein [Roseomonas sp. SXEYE001]
MTPEQPVALPLGKVLDGLCERDLARDLREANQLVQRLTARRDALSEEILAVEGEADRREAEIRRAQSRTAGLLFALQCDLAFRIRRGEFHLRGRPTRPGSPAAPLVLSITASPVLSVVPEARTISMTDGDFAEVEAVLGPAPSSDATALRSLPLWDALVTWCEPKILCDIRRHEGWFRPEEIRGFEHPTLGAAGDGRQVLRRDAYPRVREKLEHLWEELTRDLQRRIERGEIFLRGVQTHPELRETHEAIPSPWAADFRFDCVAGAVTVAGRRYISVICSLDPPVVDATRVSADEHPVIEAVTEPEGASPSLNDESISNKPSRGRPAYEPLMVQDLRANWDDVQQRAAKNSNRLPVWSELARQMHKRMAAACRKAGHRNAPAVGTVRKNLPVIYTRLLEEKTAR